MNFWGLYIVFRVLILIGDSVNGGIHYWYVIFDELIEKLNWNFLFLHRDGRNCCRFFRLVDSPSFVIDAKHLGEMDKKLEEFDMRISLLDEVVSEKLEAIEG